MVRVGPSCIAAFSLALSAVAASAAAAPATSPSAPAPASAAPASASPTVTVVAPPVKDVPALVRRFGRPAGGGRLARWDTEICPTVRGDLPGPFRGFIARRIRQTAVSVGGVAGPPRCQPNVAILVVPDAQAVTEAIVRRHAGVLHGDRWPLDRRRLAAWVADDHPVRVWHITRAIATLGGMADEMDAPSMSAALLGSGVYSGLLAPDEIGNVIPSRLRPATDEAFMREVVIVDRDRLSGLTAGQVSAYLAMVTLAQVRPDADLGGVDTIMNLFADQKAGRDAPADLTFWDRAYLQGLYRTDAQVSRTLQDSAVSDHIRSEIVAHNVLPLSQTQTQTQTAPAAPPTP